MGEISYPNIIFILADDLGYGDVGCYGSEKIPTPHIDKIASEGIRFTDAHSSSAVCSPSRYSIITGRYSWRSPLKRGVLWGYSWPIIEKDRPTIASILKKKGYHTAAIGKWHLGLKWPTPNYQPIMNLMEKKPNVDYTKPIKDGPLSLGFDYFFGIPGSLDMHPYCFIENDHTVGIPSIMKQKLHQQQIEGLMTPGWRDEEVDIRFTEKAKEFINKHVVEQKDKPFFLYFCTSAPHRPCDIRPDFVIGKSQAGDRGDMVVLFDWIVGQIYQELENLELLENTLLVITSDNGARASCYNGKDYGHNSNGHWRGQKADIWEGGHRIPLIAKWKNHIPTNEISNEPTCLVDIVATLCAIIGESLPNAAEDSENMLKAFLGKKIEKNIRDFMINHSDIGLFAIRKGDWKLIKGLGSGGFTPPIRKRAKKGMPKGQLYNLRKDPQEQHNLWNEEPTLVENLKRNLKIIRSKSDKN
ncbi:MAG: sulfatase-like hydrolase/transferase [Candidatus Lokiarchaeota archaeon]|nr:sulfatase-like hydrolase/transferase [Candidatus Lokiarchaeota archaeon]